MNIDKELDKLFDICKFTIRKIDENDEKITLYIEDKEILLLKDTAKIKRAYTKILLDITFTQYGPTKKIIRFIRECDCDDLLKKEYGKLPIFYYSKRKNP